jgi:hypothetical protein
VKVSDPSDRFEREAVSNADQVMSAPAPSPADAGPAVQRVATEGAVAQREEEVAGVGEQTAQTYVQRDEDEAEEEQA